jgi:hypothetical protein
LLRIRRFMVGLSGLGVLLCAWFFGMASLLGFLVGGGIQPSDAVIGLIKGRSVPPLFIGTL